MKQASRAQVEGMRWPILEPLDGGLRPVALSKPVCVAGARSCVNLTLESPLISRSHALFVQDSDAVYVRDLASRNHIYVNDTRVRESVISNGDVLRIGPFSFRFQNRLADFEGVPKVEFPPLYLTNGGKRILVDGRTGVIGSRDDCDVHVDDAQVDQVHSVLFERHGKWFVRDLPSSTGTFVNDDPVVESEIKTGDTIRVGETTLSCHVGEVDDAVLSAADDEQSSSVPEERTETLEALGAEEPPAFNARLDDSDSVAIGLAVEEPSDLISLAPSPSIEVPEMNSPHVEPITVAVKVRPDDGIIARQADPTQDGPHDFAGVFAGATTPRATHLLDAPLDDESRGEDAPLEVASTTNPESLDKEEVLTTLLHELSENVDKIQTTWHELKSEGAGGAAIHSEAAGPNSLDGA